MHKEKFGDLVSRKTFITKRVERLNKNLESIRRELDIIEAMAIDLEDGDNPALIGETPASWIKKLDNTEIEYVKTLSKLEVEVTSEIALILDSYMKERE